MKENPGGVCFAMVAHETYWTLPAARWPAPFEDELDNRRAALRWATEERGDAVVGGQIAGAAPNFWFDAGAALLNACRQQQPPSKIVNIDKSGANTAGTGDYNAKHRTKVVIRQCKYLNNIVEQDHRTVKRIARSIQGFKDFGCARIILSGVEVMHMIRKGQLRDDGRAQSPAQQFYALAT